MTFEIKTESGEAERVLLLGHTLSGKTTLTHTLIAGHDSVVVIDSKRGASWLPFAAHFGYAVTEDPDDILRFERVLFRPSYASLMDRAGWSRPGSVGHAWTRALHNVMERRNTGVVFDEAMHTLPSTVPHPEARRIVTQGAELGIWAVIGSQAPTWVDTVALSQAEHAFAFRETHPGYRQRVEAQRGVNCDVLATLGKWEFAYHFMGTSEWVEFEPVSPLTFRTPARVESPSAA